MESLPAAGETTEIVMMPLYKITCQIYFGNNEQNLDNKQELYGSKM